MAKEYKYLTGKQMIDMLAPLLGVNPGDVRTIEVSANFEDMAIFKVELLGRPVESAAEK